MYLGGKCIQVPHLYLIFLSPSQIITFYFEYLQKEKYEAAGDSPGFVGGSIACFLAYAGQLFDLNIEMYPFF